MNNIWISSNEWWRWWWWWHFCIKFIWIIQNCNLEKRKYIKWNMERMRQLWDLESNLIGIKALDKALNAFTKSTSLHTSLYINLSIGFNKRFNINSSGTMWRIFLIHSPVRVECFQKIRQSRTREREKKKCKHTLTVFIMLCLRKCKTEKCFVVHKTMPTAVTFHHRHAYPFQAFFFILSSPLFFYSSHLLTLLLPLNFMISCIIDDVKCIAAAKVSFCFHQHDVAHPFLWKQMVKGVI